MEIDSGKILSQNYIIHFAGGSDTGLVRSHNEDSFAIFPDPCFFCLADGVGGLEAGEVASKKAIDCMKSHAVLQTKKKTGLAQKIIQLFYSHEQSSIDSILKIICDANIDVYRLAQSLNKKMATTIVALQLSKEKALICNVGDSRAYLLRNKLLGQITIDHTLSMSLLLAGTPLNNGQSEINQHTITRALGNQLDVKPDMQVVSNLPDDMFLLCSDGLTDMLNDTIICQTAIDNNTNLPNVVQELINKANVAGGRDNITVIAIRVERK